ncbi:hypothetical protein Tco_1267101, partial [Tanacetum coccineum]
MTVIKSFNKHPKYKALYHALIESILVDEDAMDQGVADEKKKRKPADDDRDLDPPARPDQGLKRRMMSKDVEPSKKVKSTDTSKGTTKSQLKSTSKSGQANETVFKVGDTQMPHNLGEDIGKTNEPPIVKADPKDWFERPKRPPTHDPEWNTGTSHLRSKRQTIYGYASNREIKVRRAYQQLYKFMEGDFLRLHLNDIEDMLLLVVQNNLFNLNSDVIVGLAVALYPQGVIYEDKLNKKRLMHFDELHKFNDGTLQSVQDILHDMATNLSMKYNKAMLRRRWSNLDKKRSHIMVKDIDQQLLERRLIRSLEKLVGGREYGE